MRTRSLLMPAVAAGLLCAGGAAPVSAASFHYTCFGGTNVCADAIGPVVTDKFSEHYPADKWEVIVISEFQAYSSGGGVAFAVAGVALRRTGGSDVPAVRFNTTSRYNESLGAMSPQAAREAQQKAITTAVKQMMDACAKRPECIVDK